MSGYWDVYLKCNAKFTEIKMKITNKWEFAGKIRDIYSSNYFSRFSNKLVLFLFYFRYKKQKYRNKKDNMIINI